MRECEFIFTDLDVEELHQFDQPNLTKKLMSATDLEFEDNSFDFISDQQVLEHINEYPEILIAFRRLCKPGV